MVKSGAIAIFVKTPGLSPVKTRLANGIGREKAESFYRLSTQAIEAVVKRVVESNPGITPYWAVAEKEGIGQSDWRGFSNLWQGEGGLGDRLAAVYDRILEKHRFAILIGADSPQISVALLSHAVQFLTTRDHSRGSHLILGEANDGGFYLFGGSVAIPREIWRSIPYSQPDTVQVLRENMRPVGPIEDLPRRVDVDTAEDLDLLCREFGEGGSFLSEQMSVWKWVSELI